MSDTEIRKHLDRRRAVVREVLNSYVARRGCPCRWAQFEYWVSKPQGPGWQDNIQNDLVAAALALPCFQHSPVEPPEYGAVFDVTCTVCGSRWRYYSEEWRMLAFHERLVPLAPERAEEDRFGGVIGADIFATAGFEPRERPQLSLEQWVDFMQGL